MSRPIEKLPVKDVLASMASSMQPRLEKMPLLVAIRSGGIWVAEHLHKHFNLIEPFGVLDITYYRDDFSQIGLNPQVGSSHLPVAIEDRHIILIDDVIYTGRTVRAALNELFAWGRPASVVLAVVIDRGERELPFCADIVGCNMSLKQDQFVKISADGTLTFSNA